MVGAVDSSIRTVQLSSIIRAQYSPAKISLPVDSMLYARLKHVQGVPTEGLGVDAKGSSGYSLSKLQMIDLMIERLTRLKGQHIEVPRIEDEAGKWVATLSGELSAAFRAAQVSGHSFAAGLSGVGLLFDLVA